jgi:hypothetical protein
MANPVLDDGDVSTKFPKEKLSMAQDVSSARVTSEDPDTESSLSSLMLREKLKEARVSDVQTILVILSSHAMAFDVEALRRLILNTYPDAAIFFRSTSGKPVGVSSPARVDLLVDFTGPKQRQSWFYARKLRKMSRVSVGRNAGLFRKKIYHRVMDEKVHEAELPKDRIERELAVQTGVLALAGVPVLPAGMTTADLAKQIALNLPPLQHG